MHLKTSGRLHPFAIHALIIVPPILFLVYVGHSFTVIRELLSESADLHLDYANNLVQEYFDSELRLQIQRLRHCPKQPPENCPDTDWVTFESNGEAITPPAPGPDGRPREIYLDKAHISQSIDRFVAAKQGLNGLIASRYHEPVYWFQILDSNGQTIYRSGPELSSAKGRHTYSMGDALPGYHLEIVYNSFGAQQLYSVARQRINFALIFLLFVMAILSLVLFTRLIRQKIQLAKQKTFFVTTVSHEFKTPLAIMKLASETLAAKRYGSEEEANRFLRMISNEINHLNHLVHKILSFSKIEMGQIQFHMQRIDLLELLENSREVYSIRAESEGVKLVWTMPDQPCLIEGDGDLIRHAVDNVLDNAFKYRGESDLIEVLCELEPHHINLSIRDEGLGIAKEEQHHIFKSFYRASDASTAGIRGSGLGLAVSRYILQRCRAKLSLVSEPGEGSTFTILFPRVIPTSN